MVSNVSPQIHQHGYEHNHNTQLQTADGAPYTRVSVCITPGTANSPPAIPAPKKKGIAEGGREEPEGKSRGERPSRGLPHSHGASATADSPPHRRDSTPRPRHPRCPRPGAAVAGPSRARPGVLGAAEPARPSAAAARPSPSPRAGRAGPYLPEGAHRAAQRPAQAARPPQQQHRGGGGRSWRADTGSRPGESRKCARPHQALRRGGSGAWRVPGALRGGGSGAISRAGCGAAARSAAVRGGRACVRL